MASLPLTQIVLVSADVSSYNYKLLDGEWPVLETTTPVSSNILDRIRNGSGITTHIDYLTLSFFYIETALLEPHSTQRAVDQAQVIHLVNDFQNMGIFCLESPGVVVGFGEGWLHMKNSGPHPYMISSTSPLHHHLSTRPGGPIDQIIQGGHHTTVIKHFSSLTFHSEENFLYYRVLMPGSHKCFTLFSLCFFQLTSGTWYGSKRLSLIFPVFSKLEGSGHWSVKILILLLSSVTYSR